MRILYLFSLVALFSPAALAQTFENVIATAQGNKVLITYDLLNPRADEAFSVEIYGSHNNYGSPIKFVAGDVGASVKPGLNKKVEWSVEAELKKFKGDITFELRAKPVLIRLNFRSPFVDGSVRRGKSATIQWLGGASMSQVKLNLYRGEVMVAPVTETLNSGRFTWTVPKDVKAGKNYYLKISSGGETVNSPTFSIKAKVPLFLKLLPLFIAAGAIPFLGGDDPEDPGVTTTPLPPAPDPPGD